MQTLFGVDRSTYTGTVIYLTAGRAREYRELACNLYAGCDHCCTYCWAPDVLRQDRTRFGAPVPRADILRKLRRDAAGYGGVGEDRQILFSFSCDPYQHLDERLQLTRSAIGICHDSGLSVCVLTKGGTRSLRDLDLFTPADSYACTLTLLDDAQSREWEPEAALPGDRIAALREYHAAGIPTWVSLEPVIDPDQTLEIIRATASIVDQYKVGMLNYHPAAKRIDWHTFGRDVLAALRDAGARYYIKQDLRRYLPA